MKRKYTEDKIRFPNRLKDRRLELHRSAMGMAIKIGVALSTVQRWEAGLFAPESSSHKKLILEHYDSEAKQLYPTCWQQIFMDL